MNKVKQVLALACIGALLTVTVGRGGFPSSAVKSDSKTVIEYWHVNAESFGGFTVKQLVEEFNKEILTLRLWRNTIPTCIRD